ncbi:MAG: winged helix-turn-helix domain-containing protein [Pseudomonadota bacterium]
MNSSSLVTKPAIPLPSEMHGKPRANAEWRAYFGPFILSPSERLLERNGVPFRLGGHAFDILVTLVESAGSIVGKKDLMARVWPDMVVEEGSLRFHIVAIRKALGDGDGGNRYIVNTASKGYTFVARVERQELLSQSQLIAPRPGKNLPALATAVVGREVEIDTLVSFMLQGRFVSVVGAGGIGKTTVAIAATQAASRHFDGDVHFVDLSSISGTGLVRATVASAVGLQNRLEDLSALEAHLAERKTLIVLDCCEHVVGEAAELAEVLVRGCPQVHIFATSREPLLAVGEFVYRLQPLAFPPDGEGTTAAAALAYPAVRLLVDRAAASGSGFELKDCDASLASQLCRKLEGIALAIELAAGRIEALGLKAITSHLDASVTLMWHGRRTAVARHQTLGATLDWSFKLLTDDEKRLLHRFSVFPASFSLEAAIEVCCIDFDRSKAIELIASLVSKSLVTVDAGGATLRYGMLDTTKTYCRKKQSEFGEDVRISERFASYFSVWARERSALSKDALDDFRLELPNLRAALEWHFRDGGQMSDAVKFAAALCPMMMRFSQVAECSRWAQAALSQMPPAFVGSECELRLQGALGQSLMFTRGDGSGEAASAFLRSIEIAEQLGAFPSNLHLLNGYAVLLHREGRYTEALAIARKAQSLLAELGDPESRAIVDSLMGVCLHLVGNVSEAMLHWERCFAYTSDVSSDIRERLGFDYHVRALCGLARSLWLTGQYAKAVTVAEETLAKARSHGHAVTNCIALIWGGSVFAYGRDVERLERVADELERVARCHALEPYLNVANILRGQILIMRGHPADGVERIRGAIEVLRKCRYEMVTSVSLTFMAKGLSDMSLHSASLAVCDEAERMIRAGGDFLRMPELLTTRGQCQAAAGQRDEAAESYLAAIELAHSMGVRSDQVRAAVALAQLLIGAGRNEEARCLLRPHVRDAGDETSLDLSLARNLLT